MTVPADSLVPPKVLFIGHNFFMFFFIFFLFFFSLLIIAIIGVSSESIKINIFLLFTIIDPKINKNVVQTISTQH